MRGLPNFSLLLVDCWTFLLMIIYWIRLDLNDIFDLDNSLLFTDESKLSQVDLYFVGPNHSWALQSERALYSIDKKDIVHNVAYFHCQKRLNPQSSSYDYNLTIYFFCETGNLL